MLLLLAGCLALSQPRRQGAEQLGAMRRITKVGSGVLSGLGGTIFAVHHRQGGRQSIQASGGFSGGAAGTTGPDWGQTAAPAQTPGWGNAVVRIEAGGAWRP